MAQVEHITPIIKKNFTFDVKVLFGTITFTGAGAVDAPIMADISNKKAIFKNYAPFTDYVTEINNAQVDNAKDLDVAMPMYNSIEHSDNYSKAPGSLYQFYRNELNDNDITDSESFKFRSMFLNNTNSAVIINAKIAVPLKYSGTFWRTVEMPLINCEISLILTCSANCIISEGYRVTTFEITDTKLYVPVVTLST